jgi:hypothetical protein
MPFHDSPRGNLLGTLAVAAGFLSRFLDVLVLALFF